MGSVKYGVALGSNIITFSSCVHSAATNSPPNITGDTPLEAAACAISNDQAGERSTFSLDQNSALMPRLSRARVDKEEVWLAVNALSKRDRLSEVAYYDGIHYCKALCP